jgi:hypothetical protein
VSDEGLADVVQEAPPASTAKVRRAPVFVAIVAALLAGGVIDRAARSAPTAAAGVVTGPAMPIAAPSTS